MGGVCLCGSKDSTAIWYDSHRANVCNESAPSVACGQNAACGQTLKHPSVLILLVSHLDMVSHQFLVKQTLV